MPVTLNLKPDLEAGLSEHAKAAGLPLDQFVCRQLENFTQAAAAEQGPAKGVGASGDLTDSERLRRWAEFETWLDSFPQQTVLSNEGLSRESWYPDRW